LIQIDGIVYSLQRHGGVSVYHRELAQRLQRDGRSALLSLVTPNHGAWADWPPGSVRVEERPARPLERYRPFPCDPQATVVHTSYYRVPSDPHVASVVTVLDFVHERFRKGPALWVHSLQKNHAIRKARMVICISETTRRDLERFVPGLDGARVRVIYVGAGEDFSPIPTPHATRPFVLFVGKRWGYKSFRLVLHAMADLPGWDVVCVGGEAQRGGELDEASPEVRARVHMTGVIDDVSLNRLYNQAACLAYPSAYEGFGIPVLEAMRAGCPVVSTGCASVQEVAGGAFLAVPQHDPAALARACLETLAPGRREELRQAGFAAARPYTWERCYQETVVAYDEIARAATRGNTRHRHRQEAP
jgi:mannosyltransferase